MNYLIIGNSAAGIGAIESIRMVDKSSQITVISEELYIAYSRPLIAEYLSGSIPLQKMWYRSEDFYTQNNVVLKTNTRVVSVDPQNKKVLADDGQNYSFDKLLVATGGAPFIPPIKGIEHEKVFTFVRWDEVKRFQKFRKEIKHVIVIGAGLIGLKATEHITKMGMKVTLIELADSILSLVLDKTASSILQKHFEQQGVNILTENTVTELLSSDISTFEAILKDGKRINCDAVVVAIGVVPNKSLVENSGIQTNRGILVNEYMQTNNPDIFAAGDVAEGYDMLLKDKRVIPIWPIAYKQGKIAGYNMAGKQRDYAGGISKNSLEFFHLPVISAGYTSKPDESYQENFIINEKKNVYKKVIFKDNLLVGFVFVNNINRAGILTGLIKDGTDVSTFKDSILSDNFGLIHMPKEIRDQKLERAVNPVN